MPAKLVPYVVMMPKGWMPAMCPDCHIQYSGAIGICGEVNCPLANAKKAVEVKPGQVQLFPCLGATSVYLDPEGIPVTLYAVEMEGKK